MLVLSGIRILWAVQRNIVSPGIRAEECGIDTDTYDGEIVMGRDIFLHKYGRLAGYRWGCLYTSRTCVFAGYMSRFPIAVAPDSANPTHRYSVFPLGAL